MSLRNDPVKEDSKSWTGLFGSRRKAWLWYTEGSQRVAPVSVTNWAGEANSINGIRNDEIHTNFAINYNKSTIEEANRHLQALTERVEELEDILQQQSQLLGVKDQQLQQALNDIDNRSQHDIIKLKRQLAEREQRNRSLELMLAQLSGEESALLEIAAPYDVIMAHQPALKHVHEALSIAETSLRQRIEAYEKTENSPQMTPLRRSSAGSAQLLVSKRVAPGRASLLNTRHSSHLSPPRNDKELYF